MNITSPSFPHSLPERSEAEARTSLTAHYDTQAATYDMMADGMERDDPSYTSCRAEAEHYRAMAMKMRGAV